MQTQPSFTLGAIAEMLGATLYGDPQTRICGLGTLEAATAEEVAFLANPHYQHQLASTQAAAVIVRESARSACPNAALVVENPYLSYARLSQAFAPQPLAQGFIHPSAVIDPSAQIHASARIEAGVVIEADAIIEAQVHIGAHSVIGAQVFIGAQSRLYPHVTLYHQVRVGPRCIIHSGAVIGADGFGFAHDGQQWHKIAQLGAVVLEADVEVGACTSIDRGALEDTYIGAGVKIDSQVQIAHNVHIGAHSMLAGCVGIAGSTQVGSHCLLGGGVGLAGHLRLADGVQVTGMSLVTNHIEQAGVYSSGTSAMPNALWRKNAVRFKQLDTLARRVQALERLLAEKDDPA